MTEEEQVAADKKHFELLNLQAHEHMRALLETYGGRFVAWELLGECGVYAGSFRGEATHQSAYEEGKRSIGLSLIEKIFTSNPNAYSLMRAESQQRSEYLRHQERQNATRDY